MSLINRIISSKKRFIRQNLKTELLKLGHPETKVNDKAIKRYIDLKSRLNANNIKILTLINKLVDISLNYFNEDDLVLNEILDFHFCKLLSIKSNELHIIKKDFGIENENPLEICFLIASRIGLTEKQFLNAYLSDDLRKMNNKLNGINSPTRKKIIKSLKKMLGNQVMCNQVLEKHLNNPILSYYIKLKDNLNENELEKLNGLIKYLNEQRTLIYSSSSENKIAEFENLLKNNNPCTFFKNITDEELLLVSRIFSIGRNKKELNCYDIATFLIVNEDETVKRYLSKLNLIKK